MLGQWGSLEVHTPDYEQVFFSPIRLKAGTTTFDDGGQWDVALQRFVEKRTFRFNVEIGTWVVDGDFSNFSRVSTGTESVNREP